MVAVGWTCSAGGGNKKHIQDFDGETIKHELGD